MNLSHVKVLEHMRNVLILTMLLIRAAYLRLHYFCTVFVCMRTRKAIVITDESSIGWQSGDSGVPECYPILLTNAKPLSGLLFRIYHEIINQFTKERAQPYDTAFLRHRKNEICRTYARTMTKPIGIFTIINIYKKCEFYILVYMIETVF